MTTGKTSRGEKKRQQLRRAAFACFSTQGYHDTTVDQIVEHAQTSKGSFYWHYDTKLAVLVDILGVWGRDVMEALFERFEPAVQRDNTTFQRLDAIADGIVAELDRGREMLPLWLEFTAMAPREPEVAASLARFYVRGRHAIADMLEPLFGTRLDEDTRRGVAAALFAFYMGLLMQETPDPDRGSAPRSVRRLLQALHVGIEPAPRHEQPPPPAAALPAALIRRAGPHLRGHLVVLHALVRDIAPGAHEIVDPTTGALSWVADEPVCVLDVVDRCVALRFSHPLGSDVALADVEPTDPTPSLRFAAASVIDPAVVRELVLLAFARRPG